MDIFRVRLNNVDHYQSSPSDFDPPLFGSHGSTQRSDAPQVPVIRVFGATDSGQKVCAHIHGALPYLYIEYRGSLEREQLNAYIQQLRASIDHALAVSYRRNTYDGKAVYVAHITLVKGVPFFGYHVGYRFFLKIYMLNPIHMTRFTDLLHQGAIMAQVLQPFESHLQFLLQWMCDFNLYGCTYIDCKRVKFRAPVPLYDELMDLRHKWHDKSIQAELVSDSSRFQRLSHCAIEVDIRVEDILNRNEITVRDLHADFVERSLAMSPDEKLVRSLAGLWRDETRRRKLRMGLTDISSSSPFPPEVLISMSADPRNTSNGGWVHEEEFRQLVEDLVRQEDANLDNPKPTFETFVHAPPVETAVQTVLESVTDLFSEKLRAHSSYLEDHFSQSLGTHMATPVIVDENSIAKFDGTEFPYDSDEEGYREQAESLEQSELVDTPSHVCSRAYKRRLSIAKDAQISTKDKAHLTSEQDTTTTCPTSDNEPVGTKDFGLVAAFDHSLPKRRKIELDVASSCAHDQQAYSEHDYLPVTEGKSANNGGELALLEQPTSSRDDPRGGKNQLKSKKATPLLASDQLSQSSIKSLSGTRTPHSSFPVVKHPYSNPERAVDAPPKTALAVENSAYAPSAVVPTAQGDQIAGSGCNATHFASAGSSQFVPVSQIASLAIHYSAQISDGIERYTHVYSRGPPTADSVSRSLFANGYHDIIYQDAYYSNEKDVPERARDYAGREFKLESITTPYLPPFDESGSSSSSLGLKVPVVIDQNKLDASFQPKRDQCNLRVWEFANLPPPKAAVNAWLHHTSTAAGPAGNQEKKEVQPRHGDADRAHPKLSQIDGPTQRNKHGFKFTQKQKSTSVKHETQYMSIMSLEVHANTRGNLAPNPEEDAIACIFWCFKSDDPNFVTKGSLPGTRNGILVSTEEADLHQVISHEVFTDVEAESSELDLINRIIDIVRSYDPDILTGYEVHNGSWGYMIERARLKYDYNLCDEFSRMISQSHGRFGKEADRWGFNHTSTIRVTGRHMINIWRAMRGELNLLQYTMENVAYHLLHKRIPHYNFRDLTSWWTGGVARDVSKVLEYFVSRVQIDLEILEAQELIARTSEQARLIGVDFFSVFSRGSQFKVESFMFRIAKPENFLLVSPSRKQVGQQNALECLPLVMEPQSAFYNSPLLVLDFQSLYPSIMIAYNYCYSTCLGRIVSWRGQNKMGFADFKRQPGLLGLVKDSINIAPNGIMYVKQEMRKSLLAKMLGEILETRVMVKSGMKVDKDDKTLQQLLNNRQLALKLLANVTYGYTSASFSGRMPCSEIADSIVQTARETLEKAIAFIHSVTRWGAEVVYGDTDSLFVYLKGRTKEEAFRIGDEIAKAVTDMNPRPIKLKFEKVYFPCVLLAKKRYVGFKYESPSQVQPEFDAKGIETVRRDGTPAEQKIEEKCLKLLFRTADLSQVKRYFLGQCTKIMTGQVSIQDFCFAREVKLGTYADKGPPPPGALISTRRMLEDPRTEPQYGERVPYVVITGAPGARLIDRCIAPEQLLKDDSVELDAEYYISKNLIPPLERIFNLVGANIRQWYDEMPKIQRIRDLLERAPHDAIEVPEKFAPNGAIMPAKKTLENYMKSSRCMACRTKLATDMPGNEITEAPLPLCPACIEAAPISMFILQARLHEVQLGAAHIEAVCRSCSGLNWTEEVKCDSKDCPVFYSRVKARARERRQRAVTEAVTMALERRSLEW